MVWYGMALCGGEAEAKAKINIEEKKKKKKRRGGKIR